MDEYFEAINEKNEKIKYHKLYTFSHNSKNYIIYTDYEISDNDDINIYGASYKIVDNQLVLEQIDDEEQELINKRWEELIK